METLFLRSVPKYGAAILGLGVFALAFAFMREPHAAAANGSVSVDSEISLAENGDVNGNGEVDAGDTVVLRFTIVNQGDGEYPFATLRTGLQSNLLHRFWNVQGATGITTDGDTVTFPNLWIAPKARMVVSVESTIDYAPPADAGFGVAPRLVDANGEPIPSPQSQKNAEKHVDIGPWEGTLPSMAIRGVAVPLSSASSQEGAASSAEAETSSAAVSSDASSSDAATASPSSL